MESTGQRYVVVGVDASPEALVAARYAVWQAGLRHLDLMVVYAYPTPPMDTPVSDDFYSAIAEAAQDVLDEVMAQLVIPVGVHVHTMLGQTAPLVLLEEAAESAQLVIVGQHHISWLERLTVGSVASPLSKSTSCPVVIVPSLWRQGSMDADAVVVALDGETPAAAALTFAFAEAELLGTRVLALHAMTEPDAASHVDGHERNIHELLAGYQQDHPDTSVRVMSVQGDADKVIVDASLDAAMLVLGPPHSNGLGAWTWSVARQVLKQAECPLVIVPRPPDSDDEGGPSFSEPVEESLFDELSVQPVVF